MGSFIGSSKLPLCSPDSLFDSLFCVKIPNLIKPDIF